MGSRPSRQPCIRLLSTQLFRPHRFPWRGLRVAAYRYHCGVVCLTVCVCVSVCLFSVSCAKTAVPIEMPFVMWTSVAKEPCYYVASRIPTAGAL